MKTKVSREVDRDRVENVIGTYVCSQRDRGVLDEDIVMVLDKVKTALLEQEEPPIAAAA